MPLTVLHISVSKTASHLGTHVPSGTKKPKYNAARVENEESIIDLLNEELDIDSDDQMHLEKCRKCERRM
jgi:hypothetical protein